ncbi:hypothetical protein QAD02_009667 [Eretmocerus hayati]|uniref:Uncharacterized protein n=1 Tax=Eretmocerus hayati TaxID=131215 RepID=A0ACC2N9Y7_9HYME|nr:hypothetical protein QAD02_009667 [Eretmocerus hayati]
MKKRKGDDLPTAHVPIKVSRKEDQFFFPFAVSYGDVDLVKALIEAGDNVNEVNSMGATGLHLAVCSKKNSDRSGNDRTEVIRFLASNASASLEKLDPFGLNPLQRAVTFGKVKIVKQLILAGANVNSVDKYQNTNLLIATRSQTNDKDVSQIIQLLLEAGASPNIPDSKGFTPLHVASNFGKAVRVEQLIRAGANVDAINNAGETSLHTAISSSASEDDLFEVISILLKAGASLTRLNRQGYDTLQIAVGLGKVKTVEYLIKTGVNVNGVGSLGTTSLHTALESNIHNDDDRTKIIDLLLDAGILVNAVNGTMAASPLHTAVSLERVIAVKKLIEAGADVQASPQIDKKSCLHTVAWSSKKNGNCLKIIHLLLKAGASLDALDKRNQTPLHHAAASGNAQIVKEYIKAGADVNKVDASGRNSLHVAICWSKIYDENRLKIIEMLLNSGIIVDVRDNAGRAPLDCAILSGDARVVKQLLQGGANVEAADPKGRTCLHVLPHLTGNYENSSTILNLLLGSGLSLETCDKQGRTPLHTAVILKDVQSVKLFIKARADVNAKDQTGATCLHLAAKIGKWDKDCMEIISLLLKAGARTEDIDQDERTPLLIAVMNGKIQMIKYLIDANANVQASDCQGATSLHLMNYAKISNSDYSEVIQLLLSAGISLDILFDKELLTPLHYAVRAGNAKLVKELIKVGADVNAICMMQRTSLHLALSSLDKKDRASHQIIEELLKAGASLTERDGIGKTPLIDAIKFGDPNLLKQLIAAGADATVITNYKMSALHHAIWHDNLEIVNKHTPKMIDILLKAGAAVNSQDERNGRTPLHCAVYIGDILSVERLIRGGADVNIVDHSGMTCLHEVFDSHPKQDHYHGIVQLLLKAGANLEICDKNGKTPLFHAVVIGDTKFIEQLIAAGANAGIFVDGFFPIFGRYLKESFIASKTRRDLMDGAKQALCYILGFDNEIIHDRILQNLDDENLKNLKEFQ